jgi:hypothetical protein
MSGVIATAFVQTFFSVLKAKLLQGPTREEVTANVERHLAEVLAWSGRIQFYGMSAAEDTDVNTVPLEFNRELRRIFSKSSTATVGEDHFLDGENHHLVLGQVGAGKTTTLKRVVRKLLLHEPVSDRDTYQIPVVVICREIRTDDSLIAHIAAILSIPYSRRRDDKDDGNEESPHRFWCGGERLEHVVARLLNASRAVLLVDGLDEVPVGVRAVVDAELGWLARNLNHAKLIASARTGDYTTTFEGIEVVEICPLSRNEIRQISRAWITDVDAFIDSLEATPYADIVDRPLLLSQLLFLFKRYGELPAQPAEIYRNVVELLLREWDAERRIIRKSRYAALDGRRKMAFLAAVAYELTYRIKVKTFTDAELARAYAAVCDRFSLPHDEMEQVIAELETHTGLISSAGRRRYEFSHLSLQEYLCADYLVRDQFASNLISYLHEYPGPVAIAVSLSSNPSAWFAAVVLRYIDSLPRLSLHAFLARLLIERPLFSVFEGMGHAVLKLYERAGDDQAVVSLLNRLVKLPTVIDSIRRAMPCYRLNDENEAAPYARFEKVSSLGVAADFPVPTSGTLPRHVLQRVRDRVPKETTPPKRA